MATSHLSSGTAESSKMVPTLTENCFLQSKHFHIRRVLRKDSLLDMQRGQAGPLGQRTSATVSTQTLGSEKCRIASIKPLGRLPFVVSMIKYIMDFWVSQVIYCRYITTKPR